MRIEQYCIAVAATAALCGMGLGIFMATSQDFTLMPAHAHLNLLGWVSMALYGLYYRGAALLRIRLAWIQAGVATVGFVTMTGALAALLVTLDHRFEAADRRRRQPLAGRHGALPRPGRDRKPPRPAQDRRSPGTFAPVEHG